MRELVRLAVVVGIAAAAGCGPTPGSVIAEGPRSGGPPPYDGPLYVEVSSLDDPDVMTRSGAAGRALECDGEPANGAQPQSAAQLACDLDGTAVLGIGNRADDADRFNQAGEHSRPAAGAGSDPQGAGAARARK